MSEKKYVITIAREYGSGGRLIGQNIGSRRFAGFLVIMTDTLDFFSFRGLNKNLNTIRIIC